MRITPLFLLSLSLSCFFARLQSRQEGDLFTLPFFSTWLDRERAASKLLPLFRQEKGHFSLFFSFKIDYEIDGKKKKTPIRFNVNRDGELRDFSFFDFVAGGMAARGYPNDIDDSQSRDHEESSNSSLSQRSPDVVPPHTRGEGIRQGMVHVPD